MRSWKTSKQAICSVAVFAAVTAVAWHVCPAEAHAELTARSKTAAARIAPDESPQRRCLIAAVAAVPLVELIGLVALGAIGKRKRARMTQDYTQATDAERPGHATAARSLPDENDLSSTGRDSGGSATLPQTAASQTGPEYPATLVATACTQTEGGYTWLFTATNTGSELV